MSVYVWQCKKCAHQVSKDSGPNSSGCPKGGFHNWNRLAEAGLTDYLCEKCNTQVKTGSQPSSSGCPSGSFHRWNKL